MARPASQVAAALASRGGGLNRYVGRVEQQFQTGTLPKTDVHRAYAGALGYFYLHLESAIEDLFMGLLMNRLTLARGQVRPLLTIRSEVVARGIVRGERVYVDWLPYKRTRERAKLMLSGGGPFVRLTGAQIETLEKVRVIRNAIAHDEGNAMNQFRKVCLTGLPLPPEQMRPAGYLRGQHAAGQTRFSFLVGQSTQVIRALV